MSERVECIKKVALEELGKWREARVEMLQEAQSVSKEFDIDVLEELFQVADQLTTVIESCINLQHGMTPEIVAVLSAVVLGITNGDGVAHEVDNLMRIKRERKQSHTTSH